MANRFTHYWNRIRQIPQNRTGSPANRWRWERSGPIQMFDLRGPDQQRRHPAKDQCRARGKTDGARRCVSLRGELPNAGGGYEYGAGLGNRPLASGGRIRGTHQQGRDAPVIAADYKGEFSALKENLHLLIGATHTVTAAAEEIARGNLTVKIRERSEHDKLMQALREMTEGVTRIQKTAELVKEISAACNEQNTGAEQINTALQQLEKIIQQNASAAEEIASTSEELSGESGQLMNAIDFFRIEAAPETPSALRHSQCAATAQKNQAPAAEIHRLAASVAKPKKNGRGGVALSLRTEDKLDSEFERFSGLA
jgi:DNA-directed RNA polymerase subunit K/omega